MTGGEAGGGGGGLGGGEGGDTSGSGRRRGEAGGVALRFSANICPVSFTPLVSVALTITPNQSDSIGLELFFFSFFFFFFLLSRRWGLEEGMF